MKKIVALILGLLCLFSLCACNNNQNSEIPEGMLKAGSDANDYYFYYSNDWALQTPPVGTDSAEIMIKPAADTSGISPNASLSVVAFSLSSEKKDYAVNDQWEEYKKELQSAFPTFKHDETNDEEIKLDNVVAGKKRFSIQIGEQLYSFVQVLCIRYGNVYQITFTCLANEFEARSGIVDTVVNNFHFK